ncbi:MAG: 3-deoxy-manno-octulosonate cytidylyltransferase [Candidatus Krumholzibacteriia bacterium]
MTESRARRVAIIPARYGSRRFPGKPLAEIAGKPLVQHVLERVQAAGVFDDLCVATDDERIASAVRRAGGTARLTSADHRSGTERVAEVAARLPEDTIVFNVQGDEPLLPAALLRELVRFVEDDPGVEFATAAHLAGDERGFHSPHVVKVALDARGRALYFSRAPIPYDEEGSAHYMRHVGIYAFRRRTLSRFVALPPSLLERREGLEQLRALENGIPIHVMVTQHESVGVDTPEDLKAVAMRLDRLLESPETEPRSRSAPHSRAR